MAKKIALTVDERVILHLMEFIPNEEDFEAPEGTTQAGIAKGVTIERKHIPRAVKKLMGENMIETKVSHVKGAKQRKKVYFLTFEGKALSRKIWESLAKRTIRIKNEDGSETETTFSDLCFTEQVGKSPLQILMELQDGNVYNPFAVPKPPELAAPETSKQDRKVVGAKEVYKKALKKAWEDSILTKDESALLKELRDALGINESEHRALQEEVLRTGLDLSKETNKLDIYRKILEVAMRDGRISTDEQDIIDELESALGLGKDMTTKVKMELSLLKGEGAMTQEKRQDNFREIYSSVMKESMRDGKISKDEQNIIVLLKKLLEIEDKEHLDIYNEVKGD